VAYLVRMRREARPEFLALPASVREVFEEAFARMKDHPYASGPGYSVEQLRPPPWWTGEVWSVHVGLFRAWFVVDGQIVRFGAFGLRPGFYGKLDRLRSSRTE
jgi:hypothetical protein